MSFRLRKLPYLTQLAVIENMDYRDIFNMSFCSARLAKFISLAKFKRVLSVHFLQTSKFIAAQVEESQGTMRMAFVAESNDPNDNYPFLTKLGNEIIAFKYEKDNDGVIYMYKNEAEKNVPQLFAEHVLRLFQQSPLILLGVEFDNRFNNFLVIPGVRKLKFISGEVNERCVEYINKFLDLILLVITGPIRTDLLMLQDVSVVNIMNTDSWGNSILKNVRGQEFLLQNAEFGRNDILEFLRSWISGDKFQTVTSVRVLFKLDQRGFNWEAVMDEIVLRDHQIDENAPSRIYRSRFPSIASSQIETKNYRDVRRTTDQKLASFDINSTRFAFFVWQ
ncbi:unnamed protein product [Caenorhabditis brenneri]